MDGPTLVKEVLRESLRRRPVPRSRCGSGRVLLLGSVKRFAIWLLARRMCTAAGSSRSASSSSKKKGHEYSSWAGWGQKKKGTFKDRDSTGEFSPQRESGGRLGRGRHEIRKDGGRGGRRDGSADRV